MKMMGFSTGKPEHGDFQYMLNAKEFIFPEVQFQVNQINFPGWTMWAWKFLHQHMFFFFPACHLTKNIQVGGSFL